jgi:mono/diheme cytochrome c family protein
MALPAGSATYSNMYIFVAVLSLSICSLSRSQEAPRTENKGTKHAPENVARGKYIVEDLAVCSQCHTPRDSNGNPDRAHWLEGAAVWLRPSDSIESWPLQAPRIAGNPPGTDAEMVKLLTTGIWRDGKPLRPPMPQFRMTRADAEAVVAYLKSVEPIN